MIQAIKLAKKALAIREKVLGARHPNVANSLNTLAMIYTNQNNFKQAEPAFQRALSISLQSLGPEHPTTLKILINYARMLRKARRNTKAEEMEARAEAIRVKLGQEPLQTEQEG
jgi:tetratricopeptide (TPR) repeat protein